MSTTVVNAYIGPKVGGYVKSLKSRLAGVGFARRAVDHALERRRDDARSRRPSRPVAMMESGPVGGIIASARVGEALGFGNVISFDMGGTTAKASLIRDGEPTHGARLLRRRLRQRPSGDAADDRRRRGRRRRRQHRLDRRYRRTQGRPAQRRRRSGPDLLPRRRHRADHHRRQRGARPARPEQFSRRQDEARRRRRARGIADKIAKPLGMDTRRRPRRPSSRSRSPRCRSRCARCRSRRATIRATSRWWRPAAPARCTCCAIARELHIPTVIVPLFPSHFSALGMLLADERHDFIRTFYSRSRQRSISTTLRAGARRDGRRRQARACATHAMPSDADPARPALCRARNSRCRCR